MKEWIACIKWIFIFIPEQIKMWRELDRQMKIMNELLKKSPPTSWYKERINQVEDARIRMDGKE